MRNMKWKRYVWQCKPQEEAIIKIIFIKPANTESLWTAPDDGPFARSLQPLQRQNQA